MKFKMPTNLWVGISAPPTFMFGKELSDNQRLLWFSQALVFLSRCNARIKWLSLEPLSIDLSDIIRPWANQISWVVIGAASDGRRYYQPDEDTLLHTREALDGVPIFFKGNMSKDLAMEIFGHWPDHFPEHYENAAAAI